MNCLFQNLINKNKLANVMKNEDLCLWCFVLRPRKDRGFKRILFWIATFLKICTK